MSFDEFEKQLNDLDKSVQDNFSKSNPNGADNGNENENENENGDSSDEANELYCVACNKSFKSDKA